MGGFGHLTGDLTCDCRIDGSHPSLTHALDRGHLLAGLPRKIGEFFHSGGLERVDDVRRQSEIVDRFRIDVTGPSRLIAPRSGGRLAIQPGTSNADITSNINSILTNDGINSADATITVQVNGATTDARNAIRGDKISLKISVPINKINWVSPLFFPTTAVESEMLVMMRY